MGGGTAAHHVVGHARFATYHALGPSGTRAVYIERSRFAELYELAVFSGGVRNIANRPNGDTDGDIEIIPSSTISRRIVLPGVAAEMKRTVQALAFDEYSGVLCLRHAKGLSIFNFAPKQG